MEVKGKGHMRTYWVGSAPGVPPSGRASPAPGAAGPASVAAAAARRPITRSGSESRLSVAPAPATPFDMAALASGPPRRSSARPTILGQAGGDEPASAAAAAAKLASDSHPARGDAPAAADGPGVGTGSPGPLQRCSQPFAAARRASDSSADLPAGPSDISLPAPAAAAAGAPPTRARGLARLAPLPPAAAARRATSFGQ